MVRESAAVPEIPSADVWVSGARPAAYGIIYHMKKKFTDRPAPSRRQFLKGFGCAAAAGMASPILAAADDDALDIWQRETDLVTADIYRQYMRDGDTRGFATLEKLEKAFDKVLREALAAKVEAEPAVWSVYNMGYIVKTREALFSIDLVHRRAAELAPHLDFALITHNHGDHWRQDFYQEMDGAGKTVLSNFLDNYGAADWKKGGSAWYANGGYTRAQKVFRLKDTEIRTSLVDHNRYLIDFTTAFEIRVGNWIMYHTGDCGAGSEGKLGTVWGKPDLWTFFPGCGIDVAKAVRLVKPKRIVFGHLWELGHKTGRLTTPMVRCALKAAQPLCGNVAAALWGDKLTGKG